MLGGFINVETMLSLLGPLSLPLVVAFRIGELVFFHRVLSIPSAYNGFVHGPESQPVRVTSMKTL